MDLLDTDTRASHNSESVFKLKSNTPSKISVCSAIRCLICGHKCSTFSSHINSTNPEIVNDWKKSPAKTLCSILSLDPNKYHSSLIKGHYCTDCCQILLNLDFTFKKIEELQQVLDNDKITILKLISVHCRQSGILKKPNEDLNNTDLDSNPNNIVPLMVNELDLNYSCLPLEEVKVISSDIESEDDFFDEDFFPDENYPDNPCTTLEIFDQDSFREPSFSESEYKNNKNNYFSTGKKSKRKWVKKIGSHTKRPGGATSHFERRTKFLCEYCPDKVFKTRCNLGSHIRVIHMGRRPHLYKCEEYGCGQNFVRTSELNNHYQTEHPGVQRFVNCAECSNAYFTKHQLRKHKESIHSNPNYKCEHCDRTFNTTSKRKSHEDTHTTTKDFLCSDCGTSHKSKKRLGIHKYVCPNRTESLSAVVLKRCEARRQSIIRYSKSQTPVVCCKICLLRIRDTGADTGGELENHEALHISKAPMISCVVPLCAVNEVFSNVHELQAHVRELHCPPSRTTRLPTSATCEVCSKTMTRKHLHTHMKKYRAEHSRKNPTSTKARTETGHPTVQKIGKPAVLQYCQEDCGLAFSTYMELIRHRKEMQHTGTRIKNYFCDLCGAGYTYRHNLRKHKLATHSGNPRPKFQCETCGKEFKDNGVLSRHKQIHDPATYPCPNCGKHFGALQNMRQHKDFYCPNRERNADGVPIKKRKTYSRSQKLD